MAHLSRSAVVGWLVVGLACLTDGASRAVAQQYQSLPTDNKARLLGPTAQNCVKVPSRYATDKDRFTEYFQNYFFPQMTHYETDDLAELGKMRDELFGRYLWASTDERLQSDLTQLTIAALQPVERSGKFHPAVRYNAVLILGMLDATYPIQSGPNQRPPVPLKEATAELTLIVDYAAQDKPVPPFLVVGALVGLQRHAQYSEKLDRATVDAMAAAVLKLAAKEATLPEVDAKVAEWIRIQAATVLANLGSPGAKGEVLSVFTKLVAGETTPKMSLDARCQVAALLKQIKLDGAGVDAKPLADALLELALAVGDDEAKEAKAYEETEIGTGGISAYGAAPRTKGRLKLDVETSQWKYDARLLLSRLGDLRTGLTAVKAVAPADKQPVFDAVLAAIKSAVTAAEATDTIDLKVAQQVGAMAQAIRTAVKPGSKAPEDADATDVF